MTMNTKYTYTKHDRNANVLSYNENLWLVSKYNCRYQNIIINAMPGIKLSALLYCTVFES